MKTDKQRYAKLFALLWIGAAFVLGGSITLVVNLIIDKFFPQ